MKPSPEAIAEAAKIGGAYSFDCPGWKTGKTCDRAVIVSAGKLGRPPLRCDVCRVKRLLAQRRQQYNRHAEKQRQKKIRATAKQSKKKGR